MDGHFLSTIQKGVAETIIYSVIGIIMCVASYKVVDFLLPGKLNKQIVEDRNLAIAIIAAAMILGICIIIAAAVHG
jgi:putative membrane protein